MPNENGEWILYGTDKKHALRTPEDLLALVDEVGFLPLFANRVRGFSVEEHTYGPDWWSGRASDPWAWRETLSRSHKVAYGKFFQQKSGFVSLKWFPDFCNYRRNGYDFDSLFDDELASYRWKKIMDLFDTPDGLCGYEIREKAGYGKDGEKNFPGVIAALQMQTYLVAGDFRQRVSKKGDPYGMPVTVYMTPESIWGRDFVASAYRFTPAASKARIYDYLLSLYPGATEKDFQKLV